MVLQEPYRNLKLGFTYYLYTGNCHEKSKINRRSITLKFKKVVKSVACATVALPMMLGVVGRKKQMPQGLDFMRSISATART